MEYPASKLANLHVTRHPKKSSFELIWTNHRQKISLTIIEWCKRNLPAMGPPPQRNYIWKILTEFFVFVYWSGHFANVFNSSIPTSINFPYCEINTSSDQNLHSPNVNHNEKGKPLIMGSTNLSLVFLSCFNSFFLTKLIDWFWDKGDATGQVIFKILPRKYSKQT